MQIPFSEIFSSVDKIILDSREDCSKGLFVPIKGEKQDGHRFIPMAIEHGASFIFTEEDCSEFSQKYPEVRFISVESTIDALQALGGYARSLYSGLVIGVTGSVGKTTTRAMIAKALSMEKSVFETKGNANSQLGLPITLFSMAKENKEISVIELGISIPGEMHRIAEIASCDIAVFTNIGSAHLENLKTKENTCFEKMHILEGNQKEVSLYLPKKDAILGTLTEEKIRAMGFLGEKKLNLFFYEKKEEIPLSVPGEHMEDNASVAMAIGLSLGLHKQKLLQGLLEFQGLKGRGGRLSTEDGIMIIDDSYNASPDSMKASLNIGLFRFAMVKATRKNKTKGKRTLKDPNKNTSPCESPSPTIPQNPKLLSSKSKETRKDKIKMASSLSPAYAFCSTFPCIAFFLLVPLPVLFLFVLFLAINPHNSYFFPVHYITFSRQKKAKAPLAI